MHLLTYLLGCVACSKHMNKDKCKVYCNRNKNNTPNYRYFFALSVFTFTY